MLKVFADLGFIASEEMAKAPVRSNHHEGRCETSHKLVEHTKASTDIIKFIQVSSWYLSSRYLL